MCLYSTETKSKHHYITFFVPHSVSRCIFFHSGWFCVSAAWNSQPFDLDNYTNANCLCPATSTGGRCQVGFYCPFGSSEPLPCPPGSFCNISGTWTLIIKYLIINGSPCAVGSQECPGFHSNQTRASNITNKFSLRTLKH